MGSWSFKKWVAAIASPIFVVLGLVMLAMAEERDQRLVAGCAIVFFGVCTALVHVNPDTERGEQLTLGLSVLMGLACGLLAVASAINGPAWRGMIGGGLGFLFFTGGAIVALVVTGRRRRNPGLR